MHRTFTTQTLRIASHGPSRAWNVRAMITSNESAVRWPKHLRLLSQWITHWCSPVSDSCWTLYSAEHYDANIMPVAQVSMDYWSICRFMKKHCQDPYVKVSELDPRTQKDLRDVLPRSGQVYEADLEVCSETI